MNEIVVSDPLGVGLPEPEEGRHLEVRDLLSMMKAEIGSDAESNVAVMERLEAMAERAEARSARRSYFSARARFDAECPPIVKNRHVDHATRSGTRKKYGFADLAEIMATIGPTLAAVGLLISFREEGGLSYCRVAHVDGHFEEFPEEIIEDPNEKNANHRRGSAVSYARRYGLTGALAITSADEDTDANPRVASERISKEQVDILSLWISETESDLAKFLEWREVPSLAAITVDRYEEALDALRRKAAEKREAAE